MVTKKPGLSTISMTIGPQFAGYKARDLTYDPSRLYLKPEVDSVRFELTGGGPFVVEFLNGNSPFEVATFTEKTGPAKVRKDAESDRPYHYNLVSAGKLKFEVFYRCPEIIVQR